jgi:hypothetical protein
MELLSPADRRVLFCLAYHRLYGGSSCRVAPYRKPKAAGVGWHFAAKYQGVRDEYATIRAAKRQELIAQTAADYVPQLLAGIGEYLAHIRQPAVIAETDARAAIVVIATAIEKVLLLTGQATERSEHVHTDDARTLLAQKVDEIAKRRLARQEAENVV